MGKSTHRGGRSKRLAFCIKSISTLGGGAERIFVEVVNGLHLRGYEVRVFTFEAESKPSFYALHPDVPRVDLDCESFGYRGALSVRREITRWHPGIAVGFMPSCYVPLASALFGSRVPVIGSEHNVPQRYDESRLKWYMINAISMLLDCFTVVSQQAKDQYPPVIRRKMKVVPNPIVVAEGATANVLSKPEEAKTIVAVGRLHAQKDHVTLIRAFSKLAPEFTDWKLRIVGDGDERQNIINEIQRLGLEGRVELPGSTFNVSGEFSAAQLYVIPSLYESFGLATAEAFAHGLPAVGFADCPGTNELIVDGKNGLLVEPGTDRADALATALCKLMSDGRMRVKLAANASRSWQDHDIGHVLNIWERLIADVARD